jgi:sortase (surface protein transpeptidase)
MAHRPSTRRTLGGACLTAGALLACAAVIVAAAPEPPVGDVTLVETALQTPPTSDPQPTPRWQPNASSLLTEATTSAPLPAPVRLRIPALSVDAAVEPAGVDPRTGEMAVPGDPTTVGWYRFGPSPGQAGSAVLAGHVDVQGNRPGTFLRLGTLQPGDRIEVFYDDGGSQHFSVEARATYRKDQLPLDVVFSGQGPPVLTLVTCGGGFDPAASSYDSNVVVFARPVAGPPTSALPGRPAH